MRTIVYVFVAVFVLTLLRMVIGPIMRTMGEMLNQPSRKAARPGPAANAPISGELKRDPVCGTFVPASTEYRKIVNGQPYHFCSAECRDKHA